MFVELCDVAAALLDAGGALELGAAVGVSAAASARAARRILVSDNCRMAAEAPRRAIPASEHWIDWSRRNGLAPLRVGVCEAGRAFLRPAQVADAG